MLDHVDQPAAALLTQVHDLRRERQAEDAVIHHAALVHRHQFVGTREALEFLKVGADVVWGAERGVGHHLVDEGAVRAVKDRVDVRIVQLLRTVREQAPAE